MEFHQAANIFPLDEENLDGLAEDIKANGQQVAIETMDGKILDGRRRWLACERAGVKPITQAVSIKDPVAYVLSLNLHRRHLSPTQLAMVGARARQWYDDEAKKRQQASGGDKKSPSAKSVKENLPEPISHGQARDQVGRAVGVSGKTIDAATNVLKNATPKLIAAVDSNKVAVSTAARMASRPAEEQDRFAETTKGRPAARLPDEADPEPESEPKRRGVGVIRANEAINCLIRIPKNDALRKRGFQIVTDWIKQNR